MNIINFVAWIFIYFQIEPRAKSLLKRGGIEWFDFLIEKLDRKLIERTTTVGEKMDQVNMWQAHQPTMVTAQQHFAQQVRSNHFESIM